MTVENTIITVPSVQIEYAKWVFLLNYKEIHHTCSSMDMGFSKYKIRIYKLNQFYQE